MLRALFHAIEAEIGQCKVTWFGAQATGLGPSSNVENVAEGIANWVAVFETPKQLQGMFFGGLPKEHTQWGLLT